MGEIYETHQAEMLTGEAPDTMPSPGPLKAARKQFSRLGLFIFIGAAITMVIQIAFSFIILILELDWLDTSNGVLLLSAVSLYLFGIPVLIALLRTLPATPVERHDMKGGHFAIAALMTYAIMYGSNLIGIVITSVIGMLKGSAVENELVGLVGSLSVPLMFVYMVVIAPIMEEYVFRKLIIERTVRYGQGVAVVLSGLMFGLFHGNLSQFMYAFTMGIFLAFLYVKTGKLKITIALHAMVNFMGSIVASAMLDLVDLDGYMEMLEGGFNYIAYMEYMRKNAIGFLIYFIYLILLLGVVIAGAVLIIIALAKRKVKFAPGEVVIPRGKRFVTVVLNVGMLIYCIFWIAMIVCRLFI